MRKIKKEGRKAVSPLIATVLLIALVVLLSVIIYWWSKSFIGEKVEKFGKPASQACDEVSIRSEKYSTGVDVVNQGDIPIVGISTKKVSAGESRVEDFNFVQALTSGKIASINTSVSYDKIIVMPYIMAETDSGSKPYLCKDNIQEI